MHFFYPGEITNRYWSYIEQKDPSLALFFPLLLPQLWAWHIHSGENCRVEKHFTSVEDLLENTITTIDNHLSQLKLYAKTIEELSHKLLELQLDAPPKIESIDSTLPFEEDLELLHLKKILFSLKTPSVKNQLTHLPVRRESEALSAMKKELFSSKRSKISAVVEKSTKSTLEDLKELYIEKLSQARSNLDMLNMTISDESWKKSLNAGKKVILLIKRDNKIFRLVHEILPISQKYFHMFGSPEKNSLQDLSIDLIDRIAEIDELILLEVFKTDEILINLQIIKEHINSLT